MGSPAVELLSRVALASGLEGPAAEKYVRAGLEDLRSRLRGWPPAPSSARVNAGPVGSPSASGGSLAFQGEVVCRRVYDTPSGERVLVLTEELRHHPGRRLGDCAERDALLDPELWPEGAPPEGSAAWLEFERASAPGEPAAGGRGGDGVEGYRFLFYADSREPLKLHWGWVGAVEGGERVVGHAQWLVPPEACRPAHTRCTEEACRTELRGGGGLQVAALEVMRADAPVAGISFVLQQVTSGNWLKAADGGDFFAPLPADWPSVEGGGGPAVTAAGAGGEDAAPADAETTDASLSLAAALFAEGETEVYRNSYAVEGLGRLLVTVSTLDRPGGSGRDGPMDSLSSMDADWDDIGRGSSSGYVVSLLCELEEDMPLALNWGLAMEQGGPTDVTPAGAVDRGLCNEKEVLNVSGLMVDPAWVSPGGVEGVELPGGTECSEESCETDMPAVEDGIPLGSDPSGAGGRFVKRVKVNIQPEPGLRGVSFMLKSGSLEFRPEGCRDFFVPVPSGVLQNLLEQARGSDRVTSAQLQQLGRGGEAGSLLCIVGSEREGAGPGGGAGGSLVRPVEIFSDCLNHLVLHWGLQQSDDGAAGEDGAAREAPPGGGWIIPEPEEVPPGSRFEQGACETPFSRAPAVLLGGAGTSSEWRGPLQHEPKKGLARLQCVALEIPARYDAVAFVVRTASWGEFGQMDHVGGCVDSGEEVWFRDHWSDFLIPVAPDRELEDGSSSDG